MRRALAMGVLATIVDATKPPMEVAHAWRKFGLSLAKDRGAERQDGPHHRSFSPGGQNYSRVRSPREFIWLAITRCGARRYPEAVLPSSAEQSTSGSSIHTDSQWANEGPPEQLSLAGRIGEDRPHPPPLHPIRLKAPRAISRLYLGNPAASMLLMLGNEWGWKKACPESAAFL